jgi:FOG: Ankyrin repeat
MRTFPLIAITIVFAASLLISPWAVAAMNQNEFVDLCLQGTPEEVEAAVKAGADPNAPARDGQTPLSMAARDILATNALKKVEILLKAQADPRAAIPAEENGSVIQVAAAASNTELVKRLIELGVNVNQADDSGHTPLISACIRQSRSEIRKNQAALIVKMLLEAGADPKAGTDRNVTALLYAAEADNTEVIRLLLAAGADVNAVAKNLETPLLKAALDSSDPEAVRLLLEAGANVNAAKRNETPLTNARQNRTPAAKAIIKMLEEAGAK